jgi:hypothetical protein
VTDPVDIQIGDVIVLGKDIGLVVNLKLYESGDEFEVDWGDGGWNTTHFFRSAFARSGIFGHDDGSYWL